MIRSHAPFQRIARSRQSKTAKSRDQQKGARKAPFLFLAGEKKQGSVAQQAEQRTLNP